MFHLRVRTSKKNSAYLYFQLEANEGLCFYSTNDESLGTSYRDIDIQGHQSLEEETLKVLKAISDKIPLEILFHEHYVNEER